MTLLLVIVGLVVVVVVGAGIRRRLVDERHSVRDYQQTLETLRHLSEHRTPGAQQRGPKVPSPRPAPVEERSSTMLASSSRRSSRARRAAAFTRAGAPAVSMHVDEPTARPAKRRPDAPTRRVEQPAPTAEVAAHDAAAPPAASAATAEVVAPTRAGKAVRELIAHPELHGPVRSRSMPGARRRPRPSVPPVAWTAAAVVAIAVVTGVALAMGPSHASHTSAPPATTTPAVRHLSATKPSSHHVTAAPRPPAALDPVTSSTTSATYDLPPSPDALELSATGPCWVEATAPSSGQVLWMGTLQSGQSQSVPVSSGALLRLGDANNVQVTVGGAPVHLPSGFALVFDMTFLPA